MRNNNLKQKQPLHELMFMGSEEGCNMVADMIRKLRVEHYRYMYGGDKKIHQGVKGRKKSSF